MRDQERNGNTDAGADHNGEGETFMPFEPEDDQGDRCDAESDSDDDDDGLEAEEEIDEAHVRRSRPPTARQRDGQLARDTGEDEDEDDKVFPRGQGVTYDKLPHPQWHSKAAFFSSPRRKCKGAGLNCDCVKYRVAAASGGTSVPRVS